MRSAIRVLVTFLAASLAHPGAAQDLPSGHGYGGGVRTRAPLLDAPLRIAAAGAWGRYRESGAHDRVGGRLAIVGWATPWLNLGARVDGTFDRHPDDAQGSDRSAQGEPALLLGASFRHDTGWGAGLLVDVRLPGAEAPSLQISALTPEARLWGAWRTGAFSLMGNFGYRLDRTAQTLEGTDPDRLRAGDRRALLVSDSDALLVSVAASLRAGIWEPLAELSWEPWIGRGSPLLRHAPLRVAAAIRVHLDAASVAVGVEARLTSNAPLTSSVFPLEPRARLFVDVSFGFLHPVQEVSQDAGEIPARTPPPEALVPPRLVEGVVRDSEGGALAGARLQLREGEAVLSETRSDADGAFQLTSPDPGPDPLSREVALVGEDGTVLSSTQVGDGPLELRAPRDESEPSAPMGFLRGLVRNFAGEPVRARVEVGDVRTETDEEGRFEIELPPGSYSISLRAEGYRSQTRTLEVDDNGVTILNVELRSSRR